MMELSPSFDNEDASNSLPLPLPVLAEVKGLYPGGSLRRKNDANTADGSFKCIAAEPDPLLVAATTVLPCLATAAATWRKSDLRRHCLHNRRGAILQYAIVQFNNR